MPKAWHGSWTLVLPHHMASPGTRQGRRRRRTSNQPLHCCLRVSIYRRHQHTHTSTTNRSPLPVSPPPSSSPPHCSRHYPSTSISHRPRPADADADAAASLHPPSSILYRHLPDHCLHPPANNITPTTQYRQSLSHWPPPNATGPAACPSPPTPHCSDRLRQTPLWGYAPGNLIIQRIHLDCRPSIHPAPLFSLALFSLQHPQWATALPRTLARIAPPEGVASLPLQLSHPRKPTTIAS